MRVLVPVGTRPEIVKLAPVVAALEAAELDVEVVATGQHDDPALADDFFSDLGVVPDVRWHLDGSEGERVGSLLTLAYDLMRERRPDVVLLLGDTYTVPTFCLSARRAGVPVVHLEAGLRSFNPTSMEEVNRRVAGVLASVHLAPTAMAAGFLRAEGVEARRVKVVGNPIVDALRHSGIRRRHPRDRGGIVVTAHRATNVDDPRRLAALVTLVRRLAAEVAPVTLPLHPRTRSRLEAAGVLDQLAVDGVSVLMPLPWKDMLDLVASSRVVVTDSGGLQEEASYLGIPAVVLRRSTPRWEGVAVGSSVLTGLDVDLAVATAAALSGDKTQRRVAALPCPYGDGRTAERVASLLASPAVGELLRLEEPDFVARPTPSW